MSVIETVEQLEAIYGAVGDASTVKVADHVTPLYRIFIEKAPFAALATIGPEGIVLRSEGIVGNPKWSPSRSPFIGVLSGIDRH
ncbi:putative pyridoxine 5'-phosphate oxidase superfamily flavin-nucleotide-binding protein [Bradyrhizobium japonicum]|jgi:predicted pyridoxine 5'-phosphate oxidase superfamily flavin-nucleotide-binding protein